MKRIDLTGTWSLTFTPAPGEKEEAALNVAQKTIPCSVPGDSHSALLASSLISDPYFNKNEILLQGLGRGDFVFEKSFDLDAADLAAKNAFLHFDSIDTIAEIFVNDVELAQSANMFRRIRIDLNGFIQPGKNTLRVVCRSAEAEAVRRATELPYVVPYNVSPVQSPHRNLVRKTQCHSGWDWGPCLMVAGIYGDTYIGLSDNGRIERFSARTVKETGSTWRIKAELEYLYQGAGPGTGTNGSTSANTKLALTLLDAEGKLVASKTEALSLQEGSNLLRLELPVEKPELWWPAGYGGQSLYTLQAEISSATGSQETELVEKRLGFRELRVVADEDEIGRSLFFRVNGRDIWAKGANWIPFDAMPGKLTEERYRYLLESMVSANMNMVRVWGGGQYEKDIFYDLCDELGILVWQDMMFSCSMYPANKEFLDDVRLEVADQVARLKDHPCLALWCGNNENVGALTWYPETRAFRDRYIIDYDRLNEGAVGSVIRALDPDHAWWPSSPSAGPADYSDCWHSDNRGDMHYWSVWHEGKAFEAYYDVTPRFCSEFGYQSFPSSSGIDSYCPENERNLTSPTMEHHQKNPRGNSIIIENFSRYFRFPEGFDAMLYLSQVQQALAIKTAVEYWRSRRPVCMGALYWQLDDCWPVASWSSIEYSGKWKLLHYAAARFFAPQALIAFKKGDRASIFLLNDELGELAGSLSLRALGFDGKEIWKKNIEARARGEAATEVWSASLEEMGFNPEKAFLVGEFTPNRAGKSQEGRNQRGTEPFKTELFLCEPKRCELLAPELHFELGNDEQGLFVDVEATAPAFYVSLDAGDLPLRWEDNLITLLSNEKRRIRCIPDTGAKKLTAGSLKDALKVYTLRDSYK